MFPVELHGQSLRLRELVSPDVEAVLRYGTDPAVMYWTIGRAMDREGETEWVQEMINKAQEKPRREYCLAIEVEGELIGTVLLTIENAEHARAELGYALRKDAWGQGFATKAATLLARFGFEQLNLHRIWATIDARNERSRRVLGKLGMELEGRLRHFMHKTDGWFDSELYAMIADSGNVAEPAPDDKRP